MQQIIIKKKQFLRTKIKVQKQYQKFNKSFYQQNIKQLYTIKKVEKMSKVYGQNSLPKNFADQLLNCQIQLQLNEIIPKEIIMQILQLYSKGMEYFESIRSYKYMYFQRKMSAIMRSPKVIKSMSNNQPVSPEANKSTSNQAHNTINLNQQEKVKIMQIKHKYEKMYNDYIGQTSALTGDKIKKIVADNEMKLNQVKQSIKDQISEQEKRLQVKLDRRKFQKQTKTKKSMSAAQLQKSTRDSLFNDNQHGFKQHLQIDFGKVINEDEMDSDDQRGNSRKDKQTRYSADKRKQQTSPFEISKFTIDKLSNSESKAAQKQQQ